MRASYQRLESVLTDEKTTETHLLLAAAKHSIIFLLAENEKKTRTKDDCNKLNRSLIMVRDIPFLKR